MMLLTMDLLCLRGLFIYYISALIFLQGFHAVAQSSNPLYMALKLEYPVHNVTVIKLNSKGLTSTIPSELGFYTELTNLELHRNDITGIIPSQIGRLTKLKNLNLRANKIRGSIPREIGNLVNLKYIYLNENQIDDIIPADIGRLTSLIDLSFRDNRIKGNIPSQFGLLKQLKWFNLYSNSLGGSIPEQIGNMDALQALRFYENELSGQIPKSFGKLAKLTELRIGDNNFSGTIPGELGNLASTLEHLSIHTGRIRGHIPLKVYALKQLTILRLDNQSLTGPVPAEIGRLGRLKQLRFELNNLIGNIPSQLGQLSDLETMHLAGNPLIDGTIPYELNFLLKLTDWSFPSNVCAEHVLSPYVPPVKRCTSTTEPPSTQPFPQNPKNDGSDGDVFLMILSVFIGIVVAFGIVTAGFICFSKEQTRCGLRFELWRATNASIFAIALNMFDLISDLLYANALLRSEIRQLVIFGYSSLCFVFIPLITNLLLVSSFQWRKMKENNEFIEWVQNHGLLFAILTLLSGFSTEILAVAGLGFWGLDCPISTEDKTKLRAYGICQSLLEDIPQVIIIILQSNYIGKWSNLAVMTVATSLISMLFTLIFRSQAFCLLKAITYDIDADSVGNDDDSDNDNIDTDQDNKNDYDTDHDYDGGDGDLSNNDANKDKSPIPGTKQVHQIQIS